MLNKKGPEGPQVVTGDVAQAATVTRSKRTMVLAFVFGALREQRFNHRLTALSKPVQPREVELSGIEPLSRTSVSVTYTGSRP